MLEKSELTGKLAVDVSRLRFTRPPAARTPTAGRPGRT
jgi:hypothetical protein